MDDGVGSGGCAIAGGITEARTERPPTAADPVGGALGAALQLGKPGIVAASALAGYAGMSLAARGVPPAGATVAGLSALVMAAAGAVAVNCAVEAATDRRMPRLSNRSAALARFGTRRVLAVAVVLIVSALWLAASRVNPATAVLIGAAVFTYAVLYTLWFKRRSPFGAVPGGIPGALPVLIGYAAVAGTVRADGLALFVLMLLWQPPHFWALSLKYREDYAAAGVPVLPAVMGVGYAKLLIFLYASALLPASAAVWLLGGRSAAFLAFGILDGALFLAACHAFIVRSDRYGTAFKASILYLAMMLLAIVADCRLFPG